MATNPNVERSRIKAKRPASQRGMRLLFVCVIRFAGLTAAMLSLVGFCGPVTRMADLASHFRVLYAIAMFPALATYLPGLKRQNWQAAILVLALMLDCTVIAVLYVPSERRRARPTGGPSIRLLQFNTWSENSKDRDVLALVDSERFDVISLQETSASLRTVIERELADRFQILSAGSELLLLSRDAHSISVRNSARHTLPGGEAIEARLEFAGREVALLSFHAMAPLGLTRAAIRDAQLEWVARWCRSWSGPVIILGDLNATPWSYPFRRLIREGGLVDSTRGFGVQPTWRTRYGPLGGPLVWPAQIPIDHCLHSPVLAAVARETGSACGSNHFPLLVTLQSAGAGTP